jgi:hypothetical protein
MQTKSKLIPLTRRYQQNSAQNKKENAGARESLAKAVKKEEQRRKRSCESLTIN